MQLGAFSISLGVKDLGKSRAFYEALGFEAPMDTSEHNYLIMKNGDTVIGLFQGMFEGAMLTFNPGWNQQAENLADFTDIRAIKETLRQRGLAVAENDSAPEGPSSFTLTDPDGFHILVDQHR